MEMPTIAGTAAVCPAALVPVEVNDTAPLGASVIDLADHGYAEREFCASGRANRTATRFSAPPPVHNARPRPEAAEPQIVQRHARR